MGKTRNQSERNQSERGQAVAQADAGDALAVGAAVTVFAGTDREASGRIVDDFGEFTPIATEYAGERIADPARRWAVLDDAGNLFFVDSKDLTAASEPAK